MSSGSGWAEETEDYFAYRHQGELSWPVQRVVIILHDVGESAASYQGLAKFLVEQLDFKLEKGNRRNDRKGRTLAVVPRAPIRKFSAAMGAKVSSWYDVKFRDPKRIQELDPKDQTALEQLKASVEIVHRIIDRMRQKKKPHVDTRSFFVLGFGQGAVLSIVSSLTYQPSGLPKIHYVPVFAGVNSPRIPFEIFAECGKAPRKGCAMETKSTTPLFTIHRGNRLGFAHVTYSPENKAAAVSIKHELNKILRQRHLGEEASNALGRKNFEYADDTANVLAFARTKFGTKVFCYDQYNPSCFSAYMDMLENLPGKECRCHSSLIKRA
mmetsp:Transcript_10957/g.20977  ORF Transcript_10957/g.20977 Transcript_10957/m.20977 type:complete len:325 (-) Transcript_10957:111-1085(-)